MLISLIKKIGKNDHLAIIADKNTDWNKIKLTGIDSSLVRSQVKKDIRQIVFPSVSGITLISVIEQKEPVAQTEEVLRKAGHKLLANILKNKLSSVTLMNLSGIPLAVLPFAEGMAMGNYQFLKYKKDSEKERNTLKEIRIFDEHVSSASIDVLQTIVESVYLVRDLVNMPANYLNAIDLSKWIVKYGNIAGFKTEVLNKAKITALKMGGLLAVNLGR